MIPVGRDLAPLLAAADIDNRDIGAGDVVFLPCVTISFGIIYLY
jgi:hypothetical protein